MIEQVQQVQKNSVELAASTSVGSVLISYLPIVTDVLQLVATIVALASGVMAYRWHKMKLQGEKDNAGKENIQSGTGGTDS